jgi:hypothetical protein
MTAGSDIANGAASSLTESPGCCASRITNARRVASESAAKVRLSGAAENFTMWLSICPAAGESSGLRDHHGFLITAPAGYCRASAALTSLTPSSLAHSAGPAMVPIAQPDGSTIRVVGMPNALPAVFSSSNTRALGSE